MSVRVFLIERDTGFLSGSTIESDGPSGWITFESFFWRVVGTDVVGVVEFC